MLHAIYTNSYINTDVFSGIIETDISDHFPVFLIDNKKPIALRFATLEARVFLLNKLLFFFATLFKKPFYR